MVMTLVYDGGSSVVVPGPMGVAAPGQLVGCWWENLAELAGRVCYDSLGRGRDSAAYHQHIRDVGHLSVYEHCVFSFVLPNEEVIYPESYRPGFYWKNLPEGRRQYWFNIRTLLEWNSWSTDHVYDSLLHDICAGLVAETKPKFFTLPEAPVPDAVERCSSGWRTYYIRCSRACSHELVRHGDFTAISQRSTRYCMEELTLESLHPLLTERDNSDIVKLSRDTTTLYQKIYNQLNGAGVPLKQARGAARQVLPHYLTTELIFSASAEQWDRIRNARVSEAADAEIRELIRDGLK